MPDPDMPDPDMPNVEVANSSDSASLPATPVAKQPVWLPDTPPVARTLEQLLILNGLSPPADASNVDMSKVEKDVDRLLRPIRQRWSGLDFHQQAKMSFLILCGQARLLEQKHKQPFLVAQELWNAVSNQDCFSFKRVDALVKKGGDYALAASAVAHQQEEKNHFDSFLERQEHWKDHEDSPTIFNHPDRPLIPFHRFQEKTSTVCSWVAAANELFYSRCYQTGEDHHQAVRNYALNVNRFMRNRCTEEDLFGIIFDEKFGCCPIKIMRRLLAPFNTNVPSAEELTQTISIEPYSDELDTEHSGLIYKIIKSTLRGTGPLLIDKFKVFPDLSTDQLCFHGRYDDKEKYDETQHNVFHTVLVVGVRKTVNTMGGIELLIQNSWEIKPFFSVGYDLLLSMGIKRLYAVSKGVQFSTQGNADFDPTAHTIMSGSPSHLAERLEEDGPEVWQIDSSTTVGSSDDYSSAGALHYEKNPGYYYGRPAGEVADWTRDSLWCL
jgi:hypothetical protein